MKREQALAILYEMALAIGGETRVRPLLTKTLQRFLFHTSFPCGLVFLDPEAWRTADDGETLQARLELAIGDLDLVRLEGALLRLPAALLRGEAELAELPALLGALPGRKGYYRAFLRLPIEGEGVLLLLAPELPESPYSLVRIFQPILRNLGKAVALCRSNEAYTASLVAERARVEAAFQDLSIRSELVLASVGEGICGIDLEGRVTFVNPMAARLLGFTPAELSGRLIHEVVAHRQQDGSAVPLDASLMMRAMRDGCSHRSDEDTFRRQDGTEFPVEYVCTPLSENGRVLGGVVVFRDITERRRAAAERASHLERLHRVAVETVQAIAAIVELRDPYTAGHQRRVAQLAVAIARELGLCEERIEGLHFGSLIHDIGKMYIPAEFLNRSGRLTPLELQVIRTHAEAGHAIVKDIDFPWPVAEMILQHHEVLDGSGYPSGLKGAEILLEARILSVADAIEAMSSHRPYRPSRGLDVALAEVQRYRGTLYDDAVVGACVALFEEGRFTFS